MLLDMQLQLSASCAFASRTDVNSHGLDQCCRVKIEDS